jgi:Putative secretion activating protein
MAKVEKLAPFILKWEGGFSNDPLDSGGATMKGITLNTFKAYRKSKGLPEPSVNDLKNISDQEWTAILKEKYWDPWKADQINSQPIVNLLVGWGWGSGVITAIKQLQKLINLQQDGIVGAKTLGAINSSDSALLFDKIWIARKNFFVDICINKPSQVKFLKGWLNRLFDNVDYCYSRFEK